MTALVLSPRPSQPSGGGLGGRNSALPLCWSGMHTPRRRGQKSHTGECTRDVKNEGTPGDVPENKGQVDNLPDAKTPFLHDCMAFCTEDTSILRKLSAFCRFWRAGERNPLLQNTETPRGTPWGAFRQGSKPSPYRVGLVTGSNRRSHYNGMIYPPCVFRTHDGRGLFLYSSDPYFFQDLPQAGQGNGGLPVAQGVVKFRELHHSRPPRRTEERKRKLPRGLGRSFSKALLLHCGEQALIGKGGLTRVQFGTCAGQIAKSGESAIPPASRICRSGPTRPGRRA